MQSEALAAPAALLLASHADELAEAVAPQDSSVTGGLITRAINRTFTDTDTAADRELAEQATSRISDALTQAGAIVDSYFENKPVGGRAILKTLTIDIALYRIFKPTDPADSPSSITVNYRAAIAWLRDVSQGKIDFNTSTSPRRQVLIDTPPRRFSAEKLRDFSDLTQRIYPR